MTRVALVLALGWPWVWLALYALSARRLRPCRRDWLDMRSGW